MHLLILFIAKYKFKTCIMLCFLKQNMCMFTEKKKGTITFPA